MEKGDSERVLRWESLAESQGALVGRVIAVDMVNEMLLDTVRCLGPGVAGDEAFRALRPPSRPSPNGPRLRS